MRAFAVSLLCAASIVAALVSPSVAAAEVDIVSRGIVPDPGIVGGKATLDVEVKVGQAPYVLEFFCCDVANIDTPAQKSLRDKTSPETQALTGRHKFEFDVGAAATVADQRTITVRVTDATGTQSIQRFAFLPPTPPTPPPPPPPPGPETLPGCAPSVTFGLILAKATSGNCWTKRRAPAGGFEDNGVKIGPSGIFYETRGRFTLNGIPFPAPPAGDVYVLAEPSSIAPGGQLGLDKVIEIKLGPVTVFRGQVLFKLPTGTTEGRLAAFRMPPGTLGGLPIGGDITVIFRKRNGRFATSFPIAVTLPSIFRPSPGTVGSITGATEISTDDVSGVSLDGGKIQIANAAIGKVAIRDLCFSYLSAGVSTRFAACEPPSLNGAPAVSCAPPRQSQERFDGALDLGLPTPSRTVLAAYGGIAGGRFAYGGGFIDNAGIPLVAGIALERVGFGLCLQPSLLIRGDVGLSFLRGLVRADASLTYAEPNPRSFFVELAGFMRVVQIPIGRGRVRIDSTGSVDFNVAASILLAGGFVQINGAVGGFVQPNPFLFNIDGSVQLCLDLSILGKPCVGASGIVSSKGAGGCADFGFIGKFSGFFFWNQPRTGPRFAVGAGCGFQERVRVSRTRQAGTPLTFPVPVAGKQYIAHIKGLGAPPKVRITSPSGAVLTSGPDRITSDAASFLMVENEDVAETSVILQENATAGNWRVDPLPGSSVTSIEFQGEEKSPTVLQGTVTGTDRRRTLDLRYAPRTGDTISLEVVGKEFQQGLSLIGRPCPVGTKLPGRTAAQTKCARIAWTPKFGYAGPRTVQATIADASGATIGEQAVARFAAGVPPTAPKVPDLRLVRRGQTVFAIWGSAGGNTQRYGAYVQLTDGRKFGHTAPKTCLAWRIDGVAPRTGVLLRLQAGRQDLQFSAARTVRLLPRRPYAGPPALRTAKIPRACPSI